MTRTGTASGRSNGSANSRCAIYTRKSSEEGLEQDFNSLDAQRDSAENFIKSQAQEGWQCLPDRYDDGGFTGGNMDRPALGRLLAGCAIVFACCAACRKATARTGASSLSVSRRLSTREAPA